MRAALNKLGHLRVEEILVWKGEEEDKEDAEDAEDEEEE